MRNRTVFERLVGAASALMMLLPVHASEEGIAFAAGDENEVDHGIPVVYIEIDEEAEGFGTIEEMNEDEHHSVRCTGTVKIDVPEGYVSEYSGEEIGDTKALKLEYIRGRGNSTWELDKKPYKFKLDKSTDLLGMGKNKHWALLANRLDGSLLRNRIATYIATELGLEFTPKMLPVDVVMNGEYLGSYTLSETVRVGPSRVDIDELTDEDDSEPEITGGYLFTLEAKSEANPDLFSTERGVGFKFDTPSFLTGEEGTPAQKAYLTDFLQKTEDAVFGEGDADWTEYIDAESAANYWWLEEFILNADAFATDSTFFYKKRDGKMFFGPIWDNDLSMIQGEKESSLLNSAPMLWLDHLRSFDADYQKLLLERWEVLDGIARDLTREGGYIDRVAGEIAQSYAADRELWGKPPVVLKKVGDLAEETEDLKAFINSRRQYINSHLSDLSKARAVATFAAEGKVIGSVEVDYGMPVPKLPDAPEKEGYFFLGWEDVDGNLIDTATGIEGDLTFCAKYIPENELKRAEALYFAEYEIWKAMNEGECSVAWAVVPYDAQDKRVKWTVSDPEIAEVDGDGMVKFLVRREAVITVTGELSNGVSSSFRIHLYDPEKTELRDIESIGLESDRLDLKVGEYGQVRYICSPQPCMAYIVISSDNEDVAEVDPQTGVVYAKSPGKAVITVGDNFEGVSAQYTVYVTDGTEPPDSSQPEESSPEDSRPDSTPDNSADVSEPEAGGNPATGTAAGALLAIASAAAFTAIKKKEE